MPVREVEKEAGFVHDASTTANGEAARVASLRVATAFVLEKIDVEYTVEPRFGTLAGKDAVELRVAGLVVLEAPWR